MTSDKILPPKLSGAFVLRQSYEKSRRSAKAAFAEELVRASEGKPNPKTKP